MTVTLRHSGEFVAIPPHRHWLAIDPKSTKALHNLDKKAALPDVPTRLEMAFEAVMTDWWMLGRRLGAEPSGYWAHATACSPNASEMGSVLAWARIVMDCAAESHRTLVICDDPWLYRHLAMRPGVDAGQPPSLWPIKFRSALRGIISRIRHACRLAFLSCVLNLGARQVPLNGASLLVYGHPQSGSDGTDAYFGDLLFQTPGLIRILHVDAKWATVKRLVKDRRTLSLHAWGNPFRALQLIWTRWRPADAENSDPYIWLIRRQAVLEGANAQALMIRWQEECQRAWLRDARPSVVAWPWENLCWERSFVKDARTVGTRTIGYQHATIGRHAANQSPESNVSVDTELPDRIICNGEASRLQLTKWGMPESKIQIGGAYRAPKPRRISWHPEAPIYVALPMKDAVAIEIIDAIKTITADDLQFLIKVHPMTQLLFPETHNMRRTHNQLGDFGSLRAVVYAASTVGLEALLSGLPTLRFMPAASIAIDILSPPAVALKVTAQTLETEIRRAEPGDIPAFENFFSPVDDEVWREVLDVADK
tara:strand:+ start:995 stop:2608 length:1614 start_codon:yes stop_codon:yes gene_type:complete